MAREVANATVGNVDDKSQHADSRADYLPRDVPGVHRLSSFRQIRENDGGMGVRLERNSTLQKSAITTD